MSTMSEEGSPVDLYVYDLTLGFASLLAPAIIGRAVEGVWHTAVVVYGREFFYGGGGIVSCAPGSTQLGAPQRVERLGETFVPYPLLGDYLRALAASTYTPQAYDLLHHNCNHFSDEMAQFLCGARVPKYILRQPEELLSEPQRAALHGLLAGLAPSPTQTVYSQNGAGGRAPRQDSPEYDALNHQIEEARVASRSLERQRSSLADKLKRKERKKDKKRKKLQQERGDQEDDMSEAVEVGAPAPAEDATRAGPSAAALDDLDDRRRQEEARRARDPPIVYKDLDGLAEFESLQEALEGAPLSAEERASVDELGQYLRGEGSWVLGDDFLALIGRILSDASLKGSARVRTLRCLAAGALRDDISLVLHQDRRHHALLNYAHHIDTLPPDEQLALALFMCNLFENVSSSEWLLYISEWEHNGQPLSNIRVTTKVCVHALLAEGELRDAGAALLYNIATKEVKTVRFQVGKPLRDLLPKHAKSKVFDEVCAELCMAVLQLLQLAPSEEQLYRGLRALARLANHSADVPQLIALVGPNPDAYRGTSSRVDDQIDAIMKKVK